MNKRKRLEDYTTPSPNTKRARHEEDPNKSHVQSLQVVFHKKAARTVLDTSIDPITGIKKHDYYVDGQKVGKEEGYVGVTTYVHKTLFKEFDKELAFTKVKDSLRYSSDPTYRYFLKPKEEVFNQWDQSAEEGSDVHDRIDEFLKGGNPRKSFNGDYEHLRYSLASILEKTVPNCYMFASEIALMDQDLKITGTTDALFYNPETGKYILLDWKANSVKASHFGEFGVHPTSSRFPDTKFHRYYCQLNLYALMLQRKYDVWCEKLYVVGFGLDKLIEKPLNESKPKMDQYKQLFQNLDVFEIPIDIQFQSDLVSNRLNEVVLDERKGQ